MSMETELKVKEEVERLVKAVRICVDYKNLNEASPKDEYPMPMADMLVDRAAHSQMLSFMDGNAGYNQIMVAEEDIYKTTFMTNNKAEYEALIIGLEMLVELEVLGDSTLLLKQIVGENKCLSASLAVYLVAARNLLAEFREATWEHVPREENFAANEMAQIATGIQMPEDCVQRIIKVGNKSLPSVLTRGMEADVNTAIMTEEDWRKEEYMKVMGETHEGICGAHQGGRKMFWLIRRGSSFISGEMLDMAEAFKFKLLQSTPYYAHANGQAESSNKVIINIIRKMLEKNPKQLPEKLSRTL
ncbi:hypothetical protein L3X38_003542 [Prunus dulcis]|uniref:RNase H type-1 domain-containing protein n=1 Tax=Prunus dulcis TaxID=3755 RepID=A0AAD4ZM96_PRUDU|nr:hypothetical protein L3X38_003542 [Prunus dulcis]